MYLVKILIKGKLVESKRFRSLRQQNKWVRSFPMMSGLKSGDIVFEFSKIS